MQPKTLKAILADLELNLSDNPRGTDKGDYKSYVDLFYDYYFLQFKHKPIKLLEIGVRHGASLVLWSKYFSRAELILGLDNYSDISLSADFPMHDDLLGSRKVAFKQRDAYTRETASEIKGEFDIIIDDGPHTIASQIKSIKLYFRKLNFEGLFIVEDLLRGYYTCVLLLLCSPLSGRCKIFDFRSHKKGRDNMLFVLRRTDQPYIELARRAFILLRIILFLPSDALHYLTEI